MIALVGYVYAAINSGATGLPSDQDDCDPQVDDGAQIEPDQGSPITWSSGSDFGNRGAFWHSEPVQYFASCG